MTKAGDSPRAWLFIQGGPLPPRWKERAVPAFHIPLLPQEALTLLAQEPVLDEISEKEIELWRLLARGHTVDAIATRLGVPLRTTERRVAELRDLFGVSSTSELATYLAAAGF